jgi:hypothetical protein
MNDNGSMQHRIVWPATATILLARGEALDVTLTGWVSVHTFTCDLNKQLISC